MAIQLKFPAQQTAVEQQLQLIETCVPQYSWKKGCQFTDGNTSYSLRQLEEKTSDVYAQALSTLGVDYCELARFKAKFPHEDISPQLEELKAFRLKLKKFEDLGKTMVAGFNQKSDQTLAQLNFSWLFHIVLKIHRLVDSIFYDKKISWRFGFPFAKTAYEGENHTLAATIHQLQLFILQLHPTRMPLITLEIEPQDQDVEFHEFMDLIEKKKIIESFEKPCSPPTKDYLNWEQLKRAALKKVS